MCGYIGLEIKASEDSVLYVFFDEILTEDDIDCLRLGCLNCIKLHVAKGNRKFLSFEPYTFRYAKIFCAEGKVEIEKFYASEVADPRTEKVFFRCEENGLNKIFSAAVNSYRFNAVDILMDCPSRERAGWLCDSFFSGAVEHFLTGKNLIEHDYLENFLLNKAERFIPDKMLPMCYPALHTDSAFIPTWAMWFVLELSQYCQRNGEEFIQRAKNKVYDLISYFSKFENEDGLLEDLPGWVFIEWSKAAEFTDGVNYCVNMLYSLMLRTVAQLYGDDILKEKAEKIAAFIRNQSYDGQFFTDHAVRENGKLVFIKDKTEVCQYYAFFTGVATPQEFPQLFKVLTEDFGPQRRVTNKFPQVWFANAFIGNYLRMIILEQNCLYEQLLREIDGYFLYMADKTLTLWENDTDFASCNHGFASYILVCLVRCLTGYEGIDLQGQPKFRQAYVKNIDTDLILPIADDKIISISVKQGNREFKIKDKKKYAEI